jgi:hypothetical protein
LKLIKKDLTNENTSKKFETAEKVDVKEIEKDE